MILAPGDRVGPYEVVEPLGSGGMGQVFRARDARLKRDVALKVLSTASGDPIEYRARFEREAQVLASLNHPRIAQVYGVEDHAGTPVIAMELVPGGTLAERVARGAMPVDEALAVAVQLCDGLEAAHERGIVHRDLKPANIKIRPDGSVAILDFGLARAGDGNGLFDPANSPTIVAGATAVGVVIGTAAYMSPEQARGRAVDKRADIWAFGCVLFEMLTGAQAFAGESTTDILAAVVQSDPDWTRLPAAVTQRIADLLHRCLQKNPKERLRDIGDARYELGRAMHGRTEVLPHTSGRTEVLPHTGRRTRILPHVGTFVAGAAIAAAVLLFTTARKPDATSADAPVRTTIQLPANTRLALSRGSVVAISPDGKTLAFAGRRDAGIQLYIRSLDKYDAQAIGGTDGAQSPFFSPDGRWVGFFADNKLKKVATDGGSPVTIAEARTPRGEVWTEDDTILLTPTNAEAVMRVPALGGKPVPVTTLADGEMSHRWPHVLPDGKTLLFAIWNDNGWEPSRIGAQRIDSSTHTVVVNAGGGYPHFLRDPQTGRAYLVYARAEGLLAALFDESKLALAGQPVPIVDNVITNLSGGAHFDLSRNGTLAYVPGAANEGSRELAWVDLDGKAELIPGVTIGGRVFRLSPDGTRVLRQNSNGAEGGGIWLQNLRTHADVPFSMSPSDYAPIWAKDGSFAVYSRGVGTTDIYRRRSPTDPEELLIKTNQRLRTEDVSPDGKNVLFAAFDPATAADLYVAPIDKSGGSPRPFVKTKFSEGSAQFSPDGKWIAYQSNESGRYEIYARSFPDGAKTVQLTTDGGLTPMWSPTGHDLFYYGTGRMMALPISSNAPELAAGKARALFDNTGYENQFFAVTPDGKRLLMMPLMKAEDAGTQIQLVMNVVAELRQRVR